LDVWKPKPEGLLGETFSRGSEEFSRLQRRIDSTSRNYHRALKELQRLDSERRQPDPPPDQASEVSPLPPSETNLRNEPNSAIASLADAPSSPTPPPPPAPFPHPFSPPPHPLAVQS
jgi:hypothetical protein